jgi:alcohol dehydrogenase class IV
MALASLLSGLALANAALGAVHGFAAPLGGMYSAPHGAICAALLPATMDMNLHALRQREVGDRACRRFAEVAQILTQQANATEEEGVAWVRSLCAALGVARLRELGVRSDNFPELIDKAAKASSMKGNPIVLTTEELREILERSF